MEGFASDIWTLPPPFNMVVLIIALSVLGGVATALINAIRIYADNRAKERFRLEFIQNALSIDEAERWLAAGVEQHPKAPESEANDDRDASHVLN